MALDLCGLQFIEPFVSIRIVNSPLIMAEAGSLLPDAVFRKKKEPIARLTECQKSQRRAGFFGTMK